jgi:hypothetical protein
MLQDQAALALLRRDPEPSEEVVGVSGQRAAGEVDPPVNMPLRVAGPDRECRLVNRDRAVFVSGDHDLRRETTFQVGVLYRLKVAAAHIDARAAVRLKDRETLIEGRQGHDAPFNAVDNPCVIGRFGGEGSMVEVGELTLDFLKGNVLGHF